MLSIVVILVFATILILAPRFYFNEQELGFRKNFTNAYVSIGKAERGISLRQQGPESVDDEAFASLGNAIENELDNALSSLERAALYNSKQEKLSFLLPAKYKHYLQLKQASLAEYYQLFESFRNRKQNEHLTTETLLLIQEANSSINNFGSYEQWIETVSQLPQLSSQIKTNAGKLLANQHINQELYNYFIEVGNSYDHIAPLFIEVLENGSWDQTDFNGLRKFSTTREDRDLALEKSLAEWDQRKQEHLKKVADNDQDLLEASNYFNENKLAIDPLSRLLSIFSSKFPRIKITEDKIPTIIPENVPIELLSYAN